MVYNSGGTPAIDAKGFLTSLYQQPGTSGLVGGPLANVNQP